MDGTVGNRWGKVSDVIWIKHRNQLRPHIGGTKSMPTSTPLYLLYETFKLTASKSDKTRERTPEQQISCSKRTHRKPRKLQMNPKLKAYKEGAA
ncbi:hypothetical protein ACTXT7_001747 [Hymenolepis weldensis]